MVNGWTSWKRFPLAGLNESIEAPIGPGVYEVRHMASGALMAFGHTGNLARKVATLGPQPRRPLWRALFIRRNATRPGEVEYRTCTTATRREAKIVAQQLLSRRDTYWRSRQTWTWAGWPA
jgi:hypothetical protein